MKYQLEFILHTQDALGESIKSSLSEFGEDLKISVSRDDNLQGKNFKININTEDPTAIFDICAQFGRIKSVKVDEGGR